MIEQFPYSYQLKIFLTYRLKNKGLCQYDDHIFIFMIKFYMFVYLIKFIYLIK